MQVASFSVFVSRFGPLQYPAISAPRSWPSIRHHARMEAQDFVAKIHRLAKTDRAEIRENNRRRFRV
jgi:hypothetical protein